MKKPLFSALYIFTLLTAGFTIHQAYAQTRSPSVEPIVEISIEENRPTAQVGVDEQGFDFAAEKHTVPAKRVPANFATKSSQNSTPYSYIGPLIFLIALPIGLWMAISKKIKNSEVAEKQDYYPKTFQFKPHKSDYQDSDDEDQHFPKAS
jgi:hypothetical protein